jgi:uncharacterized protein YuzE
VGEKLTFRYDKVGDIMYVEMCSPYAEQESDEIGDEIVARFNPQTGEVESLEILFWSRRLEAGEDVSLPIEAHLRLAVEA